uniref:Tubulin polyglutamylase complex subunit 1 n=1 Tax=Buteo japonicus TaxID=224669 RepID=A0A8C0BB61_9AVES
MVSGGLQLPLLYPPLLGLGLHQVVLVPCWGVLVLVLGGATPTPCYLLVWAESACNYRSFSCLCRVVQHGPCHRHGDNSLAVGPDRDQHHVSSPVETIQISVRAALGVGTAYRCPQPSRRVPAVAPSAPGLAQPLGRRATDGSRRGPVELFAAKADALFGVLDGGSGAADGRVCQAVLRALEDALGTGNFSLPSRYLEAGSKLGPDGLALAMDRALQERKLGTSMSRDEFLKKATALFVARVKPIE